ncbi:hypothetical protein [Rhizobium sp. PP-F2F-G48]|uniref:hypothetical protein n=1 Tax=Rhizobium sp. PP-F2F-G48 TaxID=2135651 RepID=UPI00140542E0|nr:hypothetical protein [Rhizobium sp. PP-F2F-G48]
MQNTIGNIGVPRLQPRSFAGKQTPTKHPTLRLVALVCASLVSIGLWIGIALLVRLAL